MLIKWGVNRFTQRGPSDQGMEGQVEAKVEKRNGYRDRKMWYLRRQREEGVLRRKWYGIQYYQKV